MVTRRSFLAGTFGGILSFYELVSPSSVFAKKIKNKVPARQIARLDWPPSVVPNHIGLIAGSYYCFSDEFGRVSIVDLKKKSGAPSDVLSQLSGVGHKVIDFVVNGPHAYALCTQESQHGESPFAIVTVNLFPVIAPTIVSKINIEKYADPTCLTANDGLICVGGISSDQENLISIYHAPGGHGSQSKPSFASSQVTNLPIAKLDLQGKTLAALQTGVSSDGKNISSVDIFALNTPKSPSFKKTVKFDGQFTSMARSKQALLVAGKLDKPATDKKSGNCQAKSIALGSTPHILSSITLDPLTEVFDVTCDKDEFMVIGESKKGGTVLALTVDKSGTIDREQVLELPQNGGSYGATSTIILRDRDAYISAGAAGIQILSGGRNGWEPGSTFSVRRTPVSNIAIWENSMVLASADLQLYDIGQPSKPSFVNSVDLPSPLKSIVGAGSYILCLSKDDVSLRKMDNLKTVLASIKNTGHDICFDAVKQVAYLIDVTEKKTTAQLLKVYSNHLSLDKTLELDGEWSQCTADGGYLLVAGLHDIALYGITDTAELVGTHHFEDLAIRDISIGDEHIYATVVDKNSKGSLLVLAKDQKDLPVQATVELPTDGGALATTGNRAIVAGQDKDGKDIASIVDLNAGIPKVISSMPTIEAASAVATKSQIAIIAGRGLEVLSLS